MKPPENDTIAITYPESSDRLEIAVLWQNVFHDSDSYVALFFQRVYKPENTLVVKRGNRIVSALQMIPYPAKMGDVLVPSAYVCGVSTLPSERRQGLMTRLLREAMNEMRRRNYGLAAIIPAEKWLFDCYRQFGYVCPVNRKIERIAFAAQSIIPDATQINFVPCTEEHFPYFDGKQKERSCTLLHDEYDFRTIINDLAGDGGHAFAALDADVPVGIIFALPQDCTVVVKEMFYDNDYVKDRLIRRVFEYYNAREAVIYAPVSENDANVCRYGLACILDERIPVPNNLYMSLMLD